MSVAATAVVAPPQTAMSGPIELSAPLPHGLPEAKVHVHVSIMGGQPGPTAADAGAGRTKQRGGLLVFVTTSGSGAAAAAAGRSPMGAFVYALPGQQADGAGQDEDGSGPRTAEPPQSTPLSTSDAASAAAADGLEFATAAARALAGRLGRPVQLGSSALAPAAGMMGGGGDAAERVDLIRLVVAMVERAVGRPA